MTNKEAIDTLILMMEVRVPEEEKAIRMAVKALKKEDEYRWHDLRKDPEDLPAEATLVLTIDDAETETVYLNYIHNGRWREPNGLTVTSKIMAWRYIEPFEEDNR